MEGRSCPTERPDLSIFNSEPGSPGKEFFVYVTVDIDPDDVLNELDAPTLRKHGIVRVDEIDWSEVASRIRRRDFDGAAEAINHIARQTGTYLPPFALTAIS